MHGVVRTRRSEDSEGSAAWTILYRDAQGRKRFFKVKDLRTQVAAVAGSRID